MKYYFTLLALVLVSGCVTGHCREHREEAMKKAQAGQLEAPGASAPVSAPTPSLKPSDRVRVFKYDGSLQCNMGKAISVQEMQKELGKIAVHSAVNRPDGLMRIQMCGAPTGNANVYEIDRVSLEAAKKLGFKEWTYE